MAQPTSSALRALALEYKSLQEEPVEGFRVKLVNEDNMFEWEVAIFGPPDTLYQGGYFKVTTYCLRAYACIRSTRESRGAIAMVTYLSATAVRATYRIPFVVMSV